MYLTTFIPLLAVGLPLCYSLPAAVYSTQEVLHLPSAGNTIGEKARSLVITIDINVDRPTHGHGFKAEEQTPDNIVNDLKSFADQANGGNDVASSVTKDNIWTTVPKIVDNLRGTFDALTAAIDNIEDTNFVDHDDGVKIADAYETWGTDLKAYLNTLTSKAPIIRNKNFVENIRQFVMSYEGVFDTYSYYVTDIAKQAPNRIEEMKNEVLETFTAVLRPYPK